MFKLVIKNLWLLIATKYSIMYIMLLCFVVMIIKLVSYRQTKSLNCVFSISTVYVSYNIIRVSESNAKITATIDFNNNVYV